MKGHVYSASFGAVGVATTAQDFFQLLAAAAVPFELISVRIGQDSDAADAQAEMLRVSIARTDFTINGSGGSVPTPRPHSFASPAASIVAEANNTTVSTVQTVIIEDVFNVQAGWLYMPVPEERIYCPGGVTSGIIINMPEAPADSLDMSGTITWEEFK